MEIKTTMRDCLCRIAIIKKTRMNKCQEEYGEKGTLLHSWEYYKMATIIEKQTNKHEVSLENFKKNYTVPQFHSQYSSEEDENTYFQRYMHPFACYNVTYKSQDKEAT